MRCTRVVVLSWWLLLAAAPTVAVSGAPSPRAVGAAPSKAQRAAERASAAQHRRERIEAAQARIRQRLEQRAARSKGKGQSVPPLPPPASAAR